VVVLWVGVYPGPLMEMINASVAHLVQLTSNGLPVE